MEETFRDVNIFEDWPPPKDEEEVEDKFSEVLNGLIFDRAYGVEDLVKEINQKDFPPEKKKLFRLLFIQMGIPPASLNALKTGD